MLQALNYHSTESGSYTSYAPSDSNEKSTRKNKRNQRKWTMADIKAHQLKMYSGEIEWEEIWTVPGQYNAHEYYEMMDEDSHWELIDGSIIVHSPAGMDHQDVVGNLYTVIRTHVAGSEKGTAYTAPAGLEIKGLPNKYEPDIFVVSAEKSVNVGGSYCEEIPELIIEVAITKKALNHVKKEQQRKFKDYQKIGIKEYLIVFAPKDRDVEYWFYRNEPTGFVAQDIDDVIELKTIDLSIPIWILTDKSKWRASVIEEILGKQLVERIDPKIRVNGVDPKIRVNGVDPKIRVNGVDPKIRVNGVDPKIRVNGVDPKIRVNGVDPKTRVDGVDPKIRMNGIDPKTRVDGVDPKIRVNGVDPKIRVNGVDPKIRVNGVDPKIRVNGVDPKIRVNGVDPKIRMNGLSLNDRIADLNDKERKELIELLSAN